MTWFHLFVKGFGKESVPGIAFGAALELGGRVEKGDSFKRRDFLIISQRKSISLSCLAWIEATVVETADVTILVIDYWREKSMILKLTMISLKQKTISGNLSAFVSQERLSDGKSSLAIFVRRLCGAGSRKKGGTKESTKICKPGSIQERLARLVSY